MRMSKLKCQEGLMRIYIFTTANKSVFVSVYLYACKCPAPLLSPLNRSLSVDILPDKVALGHLLPGHEVQHHLQVARHVGEGVVLDLLLPHPGDQLGPAVQYSTVQYSTVQYWRSARTSPSRGCRRPCSRPPPPAASGPAGISPT